MAEQRYGDQVSVQESNGALIVTGPDVTSLTTRPHLFTKTSFRSETNASHHITVIPAHEYKNLSTTCRTSAKITLTAANPPQPLSIRSIQTHNPDITITFVTIFWPDAARLRARLALPVHHFHITLQATPRNLHQVSKHITYISPSAPLDDFLESIRGHLRSLAAEKEQSTQLWAGWRLYRHQFAERCLGLTELVMGDVQRDDDGNEEQTTELRRKFHETRVACFRLIPGRGDEEMSASYALVSVAPDVPSSYLHHAISLFNSGSVLKASRCAWKALLISNDIEGSVVESSLLLLAKCQKFMNTVRLDVFLIDQQRLVHEEEGYFKLCWSALAPEQKERHRMFLARVMEVFFENKFTMSKPLTDQRTRYMMARTKGGKNKLDKLLKYFSWFIPFRIAASAIPREEKDISNLCALGINKVFTLSMECPLRSEWFKDGIQNVFLPVRDNFPPSFSQLDAFFAEATAENSQSLVHCIAGIGRTGTLLVAWCMLYGSQNVPRLCMICNEKLKGGLRSELRVGTCENELCSMGCREPAMSAEKAIEFVRSLRSRSVGSWRQESFLKEYNSELWRRSSGYILGNAGTDHVENEFDDSPLEIIGNRPNHIPSLIVMCGVPGSGKSYIAQTFLNSLGDKCTVACQDEMGSKAACEFAVSNSMQSRKTACSIVDRCNLLERDRGEWLGVGFEPKDAMVIFMDTPIPTCINRAETRVDHKTLVPQKSQRLIKSLSCSIQPPGQGDIKNGFSTVLVAKGLRAVSEMFALFGISNTSRCVAHQSNAQSADTGDTNRLQNFVKFPRTRHLLDLGSVTRSDLCKSRADAQQMIELHGKNGIELHLEEKVDGANIGFSIDNDTNAIRVQNRSHFIDNTSHAQFKLVSQFVEKHENDIRHVLDGDSSNILFGEWMFARHSVRYERLPAYFLVFDLYMGKKKKFVSRSRLKRILTETGLISVGEITVPSGTKLTLESIVDIVHQGRSDYGDTSIEGVYLRLDQGEWLIDRAKVVRPGFICGNQHWSHRGVEQNGVLESAYLYNYRTT